MNFSHRNTNTRLSCLDLNKVSSHRSKEHESVTDSRYNEINKVDVTPIGVPKIEQLPDGNDAYVTHYKRCKARRQSGTQGAKITESAFKQGQRPLLPRDDSIFLLKHRTTNAIPMIVPLAVEKQQDCPLRRIQRRRKPRRFSGDAVQNETRPVLVRDDSLLLTKKKLAGMVPLITLESDEEPAAAAVPLTLKVEQVPTKEDEETKTTTRARSESPKPAVRLTRRQKQKGYVRKNSLGARTA